MAGTNASIKALRALLRNQIIPLSDMDTHIREITGTNDRLVAIVCASVVEATLEALLKKQMPNGSGSLFEPNGALTTFSAKIELAYALGLIDADIRRNAGYMREIRNVFAHRIAPTNFKTKEVAAVCSLLSVGEWETIEERDEADMRWRFFLAGYETGAAIAKRSVSQDGKPASLPERRPVLRPRRHPSSPQN